MVLKVPSDPTVKFWDPSFWSEGFWASGFWVGLGLDTEVTVGQISESEFLFGLGGAQDLVGPAKEFFLSLSQSTSKELGLALSAKSISLGVSQLNTASLEATLSVRDLVLSLSQSAAKELQFELEVQLDGANILK